MPPLKPVGKDKTKRTPKHIGDHIGDNETLFRVERIKDKSFFYGKERYLIQWKDWPDEQFDTWEPLEHLAGLEQEIAEFEREYAIRCEELTEQSQALRNERLKNPRQYRTKVTPLVASQTTRGVVSEDESIDEGKLGPNGGLLSETNNNRRRALCWKHFTQETDPDGKTRWLLCKLCSKSLVFANNTSGMTSHLVHKHPEEWKNIAADGPTLDRCQPVRNYNMFMLCLL